MKTTDNFSEIINENINNLPVIRADGDKDQIEALFVSIPYSEAEESTWSNESYVSSEKKRSARAFLEEPIHLYDDTVWGEITVVDHIYIRNRGERREITLECNENTKKITPKRFRTWWYY